MPGMQEVRIYMFVSIHLSDELTGNIEHRHHRAGHFYNAVYDILNLGAYIGSFGPKITALLGILPLPNGLKYMIFC